MGQLRGASAMIRNYVGLSYFLRELTWFQTMSRLITTYCGIHGLATATIPLIYKVVSRKLLNSEVCGNASGNGNSLFTLLMLSVLLICTYTEGPSRDRAPSYYILIISVLARTFMVTNTTHTQTSIYLFFFVQLKLLHRRVSYLHINK